MNFYDEIIYNRKARRYEWTSPWGQLITAPPKQKGTIIRAVVCVMKPQLYQEATAIWTTFPELIRTVWTAVEGIISGAYAIHLNDQPSLSRVVAEVDNGDGLGAYMIREWTQASGPPALACSCPHFTGDQPQKAMNGRSYCKHTIMIHLVRKSRPAASPMASLWLFARKQEAHQAIIN